jgi:hypothetical protein
MLEEIQRLAPLVEAQRQAVGASGSEELSNAYSSSADDHQAASKTWGIALAVALLVSVGASVLLFLLNHPSDDAKNGEIASDLALNFFVVGLLLYAVRFAATQFRANRHMEAIARNKAAALTTFARIVEGASEPEVRSALATVLAQSVFASDDTGLGHSSGDQVTLIERVAAPMFQRPS